MLKFYIPDFYNHYYVNLTLIDMIHHNPHMFYDDFEIAGVFGNFPSCIWNGGGIQRGKILNRNEQLSIMSQFNDRGIPLLLTLTNPLIEERDLLDRYGNFILSNMNNGFNQLIVNSPIIEEYVRICYPDYKLIKSILSTEHEYYDDSDKYEMSVLRRHKNSDIDFLKSIKNKDKIKLLVNETCRDDCPIKYDHYKIFAKYQLYLDGQDDPSEDCCMCEYPDNKGFIDFMQLPNCIPREKIKNIYEPLGFNHYKIAGRGRDGSVVVFYAHYFVKPEYQMDFITSMMDAIVNDANSN